MFPTINGKSLLKCTESELLLILDNPDYRENQYIDYKEELSFFAYSREQKTERQKATAEFRSDICSFANGDGGYLIYGIKEDGKGVPHAINGIAIPDNNTDNLELTIKNWMQPIRPRIPNYEINWIKLQNNRYILILFVKHDAFAPYIFLENEKDYRIYKRVGNSKMPIPYAELKVMFNQSLALEKEVERFRDERIDHFRVQSANNGDSARFVLVHIIPETFADSSYNQPVFVLESKGIHFREMFLAFDCNGIPEPTLEGVRYDDSYRKTTCHLYNNGIAEFYLPLSDDYYIRENRQHDLFFSSLEIWDKVETIINLYWIELGDYFATECAYVGISIIGCQGIISDRGSFPMFNGYIDRNNLKMNTMAIERDEEQRETCKKRLKLHYMTALGMRNNDELKKLIEEIYG